MKKILSILFSFLSIVTFSQEWLISDPNWVTEHQNIENGYYHFMLDDDDETASKFEGAYGDTAFICLEFDEYVFVDRVTYSCHAYKGWLNLYYYDLDTDKYEVAHTQAFGNGVVYINDSICIVNAYLKKWKVEFIGNGDWGSACHFYDLQFSEKETLPIITTQPELEVTACDGSFVRFEVECEYPSGWYQFQWYKDYEMLSGETDDHIEINGVSVDDEGIYFCKVYNIYGEVYSDNAELIVISPVWVIEEGYNDTIVENGYSGFYKIEDHYALSVNWFVPSGTEINTYGNIAEITWNFNLLNDTIVWVRVREQLPIGCYTGFKTLNVKVFFFFQAEDGIRVGTK